MDEQGDAREDSQQNSYNFNLKTFQLNNPVSFSGGACPLTVFYSYTKCEATNNVTLNAKIKKHISLQMEFSHQTCFELLKTEGDLSVHHPCRYIAPGCRCFQQYCQLIYDSHYFFNADNGC